MIAWNVYNSRVWHSGDMVNTGYLYIYSLTVTKVGERGDSMMESMMELLGCSRRSRYRFQRPAMVKKWGFVACLANFFEVLKNGRSTILSVESVIVRDQNFADNFALKPIRASSVVEAHIETCAAQDTFVDISRSPHSLRNIGHKRGTFRYQASNCVPTLVDTKIFSYGYKNKLQRLSFKKDFFAFL